MERTSTFLAALASAAVPGLDPVSVEALPSHADEDYDVAFVQDTEHRRWVVRAPRSEAAGARMDLTVTLLQLLTRRLPFAIPAPRGFVELREGGRAMVYPYLPGHNLAYDRLPSGAGPAADLGRALAALHNSDARLFEEAGVPTYDTDGYRRRRLAELDRAAESGRVPTGLLTRWEHALEDVTLWQFAPVPVHGDLTGEQVLAVFEDDSDASTGRIRGITGWEDAKVADPADDFAALVHEAEPGTVETVLEAYAHARVERPDANLLVRARLVWELSVVSELMRADARGDADAVEAISARLRRLDDQVHAEDASDDYKRTSLTPVALRGRVAQPPVVLEEDDDEELADFTSTDDGDATHVTADETAEDEPAAGDEPAPPDDEPADDEPAVVVEEPSAHISVETTEIERVDVAAENEPNDAEDEDAPGAPTADGAPDVVELDEDDDVTWTPRTFPSRPRVAVVTEVESVEEEVESAEDDVESAEDDDAVAPDEDASGPDVRSRELPPEPR